MKETKIDINSMMEKIHVSWPYISETTFESAVDHNGRDVFMCAVINQDVATMYEVAALGCPRKRVDQNNKNAIMYAIETGNPEVVQAAIKCGAVSTDKKYTNLLLLANEQRNKEIRLLIWQAVKEELGEPRFYHYRRDLPCAKRIKANRVKSYGLKRWLSLRDRNR